MNFYEVTFTDHRRAFTDVYSVLTHAENPEDALAILRDCTDFRLGHITGINKTGCRAIVTRGSRLTLKDIGAD